MDDGRSWKSRFSPGAAGNPAGATETAAIAGFTTDRFVIPESNETETFEPASSANAGELAANAAVMSAAAVKIAANIG